MSRTRYLVSYDIAHPKRLRRVARVLEGFGVRLQYSVFECPLDDMRLAQAKAALQGVLNHDEDQVLFVSLGPAAGDATLIIESDGLALRGADAGHNYLIFIMLNFTLATFNLKA